MMNVEPRSTEPADTPAAGSLGSPARRRLFKGAAGGAGVLLAVQAKTALGNPLCRSPSAIMSGNTSPRPSDGKTCSGGRSPGFWKVPQKFQYWGPAGGMPPTFNSVVDVCQSGMGNLEVSDILNHGTSLNTTFPGASAFFPQGLSANAGIWVALAFPTLFTANGQLLRHLSAAWLNAGYFKTTSQSYPLTQAQVVAMWNATKNGGTYCPSSITCTTGWSASEVISYIETMYDINDGVGPDLCKKK